jgi:CheY-like chemotaxis protein
MRDSGGGPSLALDEALSHALCRRKGLTEHLPEGDYTSNRDGSLHRYNCPAAELWGEPRAGDPTVRYCGTLKAYIAPANPFALQNASMAGVLRTGSALPNTHVVIVRPDGTRLQILANLELLRDRAGNFADGDEIEWRLSVPLPLPSPLSSDPRVEKAAMPSPPIPAILLVEDEALVAMDIADCITEAGYRVLGPVGNLSEALKMGSVGVFDAALLDANLGGHKVDQLATTLTKRNIPFAFVTGYGRDTLPEAFRHIQVVTKPYEQERLKQVIRNLLERNDPTGTLPVPGSSQEPKN